MDNKVGRPKTSTDTVRHCPYCDLEFILPEWNKKKFCTARHAYLYSKGKPRPIGNRPTVAKICINDDCTKQFFVYPSHRYQQACSRECHEVHLKHAAELRVSFMSEPEIAWFAGLFDGEGSIVLAKRNSENSKAARIIIYNTVRELLEQVIRFTGVGVIHERKSKNPRHADSYYWQCGGGEAVAILRQVRPWLIVKADRADAVLSGESFERQSRWDDIYG